jgi:hypothetical protein
MEALNMRAHPFLWLILAAVAIRPSIVRAQTEGLPAIAKETFRPRSEVVPVAPVTPAVTERVAVEPRLAEPQAPPVTVVEKPPVAVERPAVVVEKPVVRETVVAEPVTTWWVGFARNRFGFYDDGYVDDDWYYDFYETPKAAAVVVRRPAAVPLGYRTGWSYEPLAERGLFSW